MVFFPDHFCDAGGLVDAIETDGVHIPVVLIAPVEIDLGENMVVGFEKFYARIAFANFR